MQIKFYEELELFILLFSQVDSKPFEDFSRIEMRRDIESTTINENKLIYAELDTKTFAILSQHCGK